MWHNGLVFSKRLYEYINDVIIMLAIEQSFNIKLIIAIPTTNREKFLLPKFRDECD